MRWRPLFAGVRAGDAAMPRVQALREVVLWDGGSRADGGMRRGEGGWRGSSHEKYLSELGGSNWVPGQRLKHSQATAGGRQQAMSSTRSEQRFHGGLAIAQRGGRNRAVWVRYRLRRRGEAWMWWCRVASKDGRGARELVN